MFAHLLSRTLLRNPASSASFAGNLRCSDEHRERPAFSGSYCDLCSAVLRVIHVGEHDKILSSISFRGRAECSNTSRRPEKQREKSNLYVSREDASQRQTTQPRHSADGIHDGVLSMGRSWPLRHSIHPLSIEHGTNASRSS